jgi:hypothetical protein
MRRGRASPNLPICAGMLFTALLLQWRLKHYRRVKNVERRSVTPSRLERPRPHAVLDGAT